MFVFIALLFVLILATVFYPANVFDTGANAYMQQYQMDFLTTFARFLSDVGGLEGISLVAVLLLICVLYRRDWQSVRWLGLSFGLTVALSWAMKWLFARPRPAWHIDGLQTFGSSFPSGHSAYAMWLSCLIFVLIRHGKRYHYQDNVRIDKLQADKVKDNAFWHYLCFLWALLMGLSRVYVGAHFPTDVLVGWGVALTIMWLVVRYC